jgi:Tol biopolymer transport system component
MNRATVRFASAAALSVALLSVLGGLGAQRSSGADPTTPRIQAGQRVSVSATVPITARATIAGRRVARTVSRPTRLQKLVGGSWRTATTRSAARSGRVTFTFAAPTTTTRYRVVAPAYRVGLTRKVAGRKVTKRVALPTWTGPARTISITPSPSQSPTQTPTQSPTQSPTQTPTPRLSLLTPRQNDPNPYLYDVSMDESGQSVAFTAMASDLVPGDDNNQMDVFVVDTDTGKIDLVSRALDGTSANNVSSYGDISPDGRYVGFTSQASDIVPGLSADGYQQVYLYDRETHHTELVSATPEGAPGDGDSRLPSISRDGKFVAFQTDAPNLTIRFPGVNQIQHVVRRTRSTGQLDLVTYPRGFNFAGASTSPSLSDDGSRVAFTSESEHLVPDDDNGLSDVFLYDFDTLLRKLISTQPDGSGLRNASNSPIISGDGSSVIWGTEARNVVPGDDNGGEDAFRYNVALRKNTLLSHAPDGRSLDGRSGPVALDRDGSHALLWSTWNTHGTGAALYLCDVATGAVRPIGLGPDGTSYHSSNAALAAGGERVAFSTNVSLTPDDTAPGGDVYFWESGR